jgi:hypothetical protein
LPTLDDGRLLHQVAQRWTAGTTHVVFEPVEIITKLAALIPARVQLVSYHGMLAPGAPGRDRIVPQPAVTEESAAPYAQNTVGTRFDL